MKGTRAGDISGTFVEVPSDGRTPVLAHTLAFLRTVTFAAEMQMASG